jgi:hypothetical protein
MKKIISGVSIALLVLFCAGAYAQRGNGGGMDPAALKQKLVDSLHLTGVQADSVVAIGQEFRPKMRDIFMDQSLSQDDKRAKAQDLNQQRMKRIQAVLGDDLFKKYQDWEEKNRPQRNGGGGMRANQ